MYVFIVHLRSARLTSRLFDQYGCIAVKQYKRVCTDTVIPFLVIISLPLTGSNLVYELQDVLDILLNKLVDVPVTTGKP